jgi:hypothetical protein
MYLHYMTEASVKLKSNAFAAVGSVTDWRGFRRTSVSANAIVQIATASAPTASAALSIPVANFAKVFAYFSRALATGICCQIHSVGACEWRAALASVSAWDIVNHARKSIAVVQAFVLMKELAVSACDTVLSKSSSSVLANETIAVKHIVCIRALAAKVWNTPVRDNAA